MADRHYSWGPNTWFDFPVEWEHILDTHCEKFVCQVEICPESQREHLQFFTMFKHAKTFTAVQGIFPGAHLQVTKNRHAAKAYCQKSRTAVDGSLRVKGWDARLPPKDPLEGLVLYPWQELICEILKGEPDPRAIHWVWEPDGNIGKSALVKHLCLVMPGVLPVGGKAADMKHLIHGWLQAKKVLSAVLIDLTRSREQFLSYEGIEDIKNGLFVNTKYETAVCIFDPPHIVIFANWPPRLEALSADRWVIHEVEK